MMWNGTNRWVRTLGVAVATLGLAACGDSTGPVGTGQMSVSLQESGSGSSSIMASVSQSESSSSEISLSSVSSVEITLERVEALPSGQPAEGGWVSLDVDGEVTIDLMDLAAAGPIALADGTVPAGTYTSVRLFFSSANITTSEEITLEGGGTVAAGTYDLFIPSGMQTGVKVALGAVTVFEDESETVVLEIDTEGSVQTVVYNEPLGFIMNSVLIQAGAGL